MSKQRRKTMTDLEKFEELTKALQDGKTLVRAVITNGKDKRKNIYDDVVAKHEGLADDAQTFIYEEY